MPEFQYMRLDEDQARLRLDQANFDHIGSSYHGDDISITQAMKNSGQLSDSETATTTLQRMDFDMVHRHERSGLRRNIMRIVSFKKLVLFLTFVAFILVGVSFGNTPSRWPKSGAELRSSCAKTPSWKGWHSIEYAFVL